MKLKKPLLSASGLALALAASGCLFSLLSPPTPVARNPADTTPTSNASVGAAYGKLPLSFEANRGQTDERVKFLTRGTGYALFLTSTEAVLRLQKADLLSRSEKQSFALRESPSLQSKSPESAVLRMKLAGANPNPKAAGLDELPGKSNYFIGNDPKKWRTGVPTYAKVQYKDVYPGVDLVYYGNNQRQVEYDFTVAPGANPRNIALDFEGVDKIEQTDGDLVLHMAGGQLRLQKPLIYQEKDDAKFAISGGYTLKSEHRVGFEITSYDATRPLVIDPVLGYSTYLGGMGRDIGLGIAVNAQGDAFVTGATLSLNFPTVPANSKFGPGGGWDAFVSRLNAAGSALVYSCYLGGTNDENFYGNLVYGGIAVDDADNAYVTGITTSNDFPTFGAFDTTLNSISDAYVTKLNPSGSALVYSTFLGGDGFDAGHSIAVDFLGNAYVTGDGSVGLPVVNGFQPVHSAGCFTGDDAFVVKLNPAGSALLYSTYFGGNGCNLGWGIAVDGSQNAYVVGETLSTNFPTTPGAFDTSCGTDGTCNGQLADIFVTKIDTTIAGPASLIASTYLGGSNEERSPRHSIAVDPMGNIYVTGLTLSSDFPTANAVQNTLNGPIDAFVTKFNPQLSNPIYSTYLGGISSDAGSGVAADLNGNTYVAGFGTVGFPTTPAASICQNTDAFVVKLNPVGSFVYSLCLGGNGKDAARDIALDPSGCVYVTGGTASSDFPTVSPLQASFGGGLDDAFVLKLCDGLDHFKCYEVRPNERFVPFDVLLRDQFETQVVTVVKPVTLCNPVVKCVNGDCSQVLNPDDHLVCYETKDGRGTPRFQQQEVIVSNQFGQQQRLTVLRRTNLLCAPSLKVHVGPGR